jgi:hypothetical protein
MTAWVGRLELCPPPRVLPARGWVDGLTCGVLWPVSTPPTFGRVGPKEVQVERPTLVRAKRELDPLPHLTVLVLWHGPPRRSRLADGRLEVSAWRHRAALR